MTNFNETSFNGQDDDYRNDGSVDTGSETTNAVRPDPDKWDNADGDNEPDNYTNLSDPYDDDEDEDDDLIPIEDDDDDIDAADDVEDDDLDDESVVVDDDDDFDDDDEDEDLDPLADRPTTFEAGGDFASRSHGRTTGTMIDHEPGIPGPLGGRQ